MTKRRGGLGLGVASLIALGTPAVAQDVSMLEEIIVEGRRTLVRPDKVAGATRTATAIERVPQSIQVVTSEVIAEQQLVRLSDAVVNASNVQQGGSQGNRSETFILRGFETSSYAVDSIMLNPAQNFTETVRDLANVAQIEVIKGPASVLYGRGEPGGVINIVTRRPSETFSADGGLQFGSFGLRRAQGSVTGALGAGVSGPAEPGCARHGQFQG